MKRTRLKQVIALLLACLMVLGLVPGGIYDTHSSGIVKAEEFTDEEWNSLNDDAAMESGSTEPVGDSEIPDSGIWEETPSEIPEDEQTETPEEVPTEVPEETLEETPSGDTEEMPEVFVDFTPTEENNEAEVPEQEAEDVPEFYDSAEPEAEEARITEPSEGYWAKETIYFVNLFWEEQDLQDVYAVFQGGTQDDLEILMSRGDRGKYSVTVPEGDYSRVSFCGLSEKDESGDAESSDSKTENTYKIYGTPFQYYGEESAAAECVPVMFVPDVKNTFYYDTVSPQRSYWGADALYEGPIGGISTFAMTDAARDQAGQTLYFVDLTAEGRTRVKRVTMQFFESGHATDAEPSSSSVMYEGRTGIFSAPIPEGGYEEVTFYIEFDDGTSYQMTRHFNIYESASEDGTNLAESFIYEAGVMDTFFFNNVAGEVSIQNMLDSYWGPHPSVTNRSLSAQYFYVDTTDRNGNGIFLDPATLTIDYGTGPVSITQYSRDPAIYYYQFPIDCTAVEQTILTLKGNLGYTDDYTGEKTYEEITFRFCYPYNSDKKMIIADNLREMAPVFEEFTVADTDTIYVMYDNSTTDFETIQYRVKTETGNWTSWTALSQMDPDDWTGKPNAAVVENLWGTEISSDYKYVQFRGTDDTGRNPTYRWYTTSTTSTDSLALIPSSTINYPCFYGMKTDDTGSTDVNTTTINGVWMSALEVRNLGDSTVNIPSGTFRKEENSYYGTSTFYDYYTDFEMRGVKLSDNGDYTNMIANTVNTVVSDYYKEKNISVNPLYLDRQGGDNSLGLYNYNNALNSWSSSQSTYITSGAVDSSLSDEKTLTSNGVEIPLFNESFLRGSNSAGANLGQVYNNVHYPFTKNSDGYWEFDSSKSEQTLRMKYDVNEGYFLDRTGERLGVIVDGEVNSFFPFNGAGDQTSFYDRTHLNYLFGTRFDIPFTLPEGNEVVMEEGAAAVPVTFTFSGDDDAWVFVDGQLLLDIGGIHNAITGTINFKEGTATVNAGGDKNGSSLTKTFTLDPTIENHTLTMFYMERGRGSSNLKVTFNFPKSNSLNVTNEIDTSAANPIFSSALANIGSFAYRIANKVTSGDALSVEDSAGYVGLGAGSVFHEINGVSGVSCDTGYTSVSQGDSNSLKIQQKNPLNTQNTDADIVNHLVSVSGGLDISDQAYLRFVAYNDSDEEDNAGESIFVAFRDSSGNRIGGWASRVAYSGSSNSLGSREWSLVRVDINKLQYMNGATSFDRSNVVAVEFATRNTTPVLIDNLEFYQAVTQLPSHGFSVEQEDISDYGSVQAGGNILSQVHGAWYGYYQAGLARSAYRMVENGFFGIGNNERAEFLDKFRVGSYLQITQEDIDPRVFDTTWSIREGANQDTITENSLLASRTDIQKVKNTGERLSLEDISGTRPDDGRIAISGGSEASRPTDAEGSGGSLVYRSYENPDDNEMNPVNLTVAFKNVLKTGSLTIQKELNLEEGQTAVGAVYQFDVSFTNIAGMGLADAPVTTTVEVVIGPDGRTGSATIEGIPAGTDYEIHERKASGLELQGVTAGTVESHEDVTTYAGSADGPAYATGTAYASDQAFIFTNAVEPFVMTIEKQWEDESIAQQRPNMIGIRIWRKTSSATADEWENVTKDFYGNEMNIVDDDYMTLDESSAVPDNENIWRTTTSELPVISPEGKVYIYRIEEVKADGATGWSLDNYVAEYIQGDPITGAYVVINRPNAVGVKKVWEDGNDPSRPIAVRVKLQRKLEGETDAAYQDLGDDYTVELSTNGNPRWEHVFEAVERVNAAGERYTYRAVETHLIYAASQGNGDTDREIEVNPDGDTNGYQVQYTSNEDNTLLTITNAKGSGQVVLMKKDRSDETPLAGAVFKLERLKVRDAQREEELENSFQDGQYDNVNWTVDLNYSSVEYTTDKEGKIDFGYLPFGYYRVTEIKAPKGYVLLEKPYDFRITQEALDELKAEGKDYMTLEITNQSVIALPISGAAGTLMFTLAGLILLVSSLLLYRMHLQRARKRIRKQE